MEFTSGPRTPGCFLCEASADDDTALVVARFPFAFVILNRYPYNTGHVMIAPERHAADITDLTEQERDAMFSLVSHAIDVLRSEFAPEGFNVGANLGEAAGAGLPDHFHVHVVPRWKGDTNFMPVVGEAKVLPELLEVTYERLGRAFKGRQPRKPPP